MTDQAREVAPGILEVDEETHRRWLQEEVQRCIQAEEELKRDCERRLTEGLAELREEREGCLRELEETNPGKDGQQHG